jgi:hypothetical protein
MHAGAEMKNFGALFSWRRHSLLEKGRRSLLEKGLRRVAADADGRQRRAPKEGVDGGWRRRVGSSTTGAGHFAMGKIGEKEEPKG